MRRKRLVWALLAIGAVCIAQASWIHAKAWLAQRLIERAWRHSLAHAAPLRPWPWADTHPIARLTFDAASRPLYVLAHASGEALAFGPAHDSASVLPGERGNSVISAHRDTHFAVLRNVRLGAVLTVERPGGVVSRFRITSAEVVDSARMRIALGGEVPRLTLVTCYPFDAVSPGGSLRFVVTADWIEDGAIARPSMPQQRERSASS